MEKEKEILNLTETTNEPVVYKTKDIQKILGINPNKAYDLMKSSVFPSIKLGGTYIITKEALIEWLNANKNKKIDI